MWHTEIPAHTLTTSSSA